MNKQIETHHVARASCSCGWARNAATSQEASAAAGVHSLRHKVCSVASRGAWLGGPADLEAQAHPLRVYTSDWEA